jgi:sigma-B regulation protein RsbU (phosphoserine phosphatase)
MNYKKPANLLEMLNERLCVGNDTNLFVTLFCGFLNVKTGVMNYSNAGHCAPIIISDGKSAMLEIPKGVLAGVFPGLKYKAMKHTLNPGDTLFCYTDGVTEAQNREGNDFTEERCKEFLDHSATMALPDLLDAMRQEVITFTQTKILEDDCTMIALRRNELPKKKAHL